MPLIRPTLDPFPSAINRRPLALQVGVDAADPYGLVAGDTFARADSASALSAADSGQPWHPNNCTAGIASKRLYVPASSVAGQSFAWVETGLTNASIRAQLVALPSAAAYLVARFDGAQSFLLFYVTPTLYQVQRCSAGVLTLLATLGQTPVAGDQLHLEMHDRICRAWVNDVQGAAISSSTSLGSTKHGLGADDATARWASFSVVAE